MYVDSQIVVETAVQVLFVVYDFLIDFRGDDFYFLFDLYFDSLDVGFHGLVMTLSHFDSLDDCNVLQPSNSPIVNSFQMWFVGVNELSKRDKRL